MKLNLESEVLCGMNSEKLLPNHIATIKKDKIFQRCFDSRNQDCLFGIFKENIQYCSYRKEKKEELTYRLTSIIKYLEFSRKH